MKINKVFCLFEQYGTFKNEFKKLGIDAEDYDILNSFNETDHMIDLFEEIENGYSGKKSIFDEVGGEDLIMAFFPCIRVENQIMLFFRGQSRQVKNWSIEKKMEYDMELMEDVNRMYQLINKLFLICMRRGLRLICENPYSEEHLLRRYWCVNPTMIDRDRRMNGDYFKKPTQYWFINCEPENNILFEALPRNAVGFKDSIEKMGKKEGTEQYKKMGAKNYREARSMIHNDYADRFIRQFIIDGGVV
jgi:hypothetical protein